MTELAAAWTLMLELADRARRGAPLCARSGFAWRDERWLEVADAEAQLWIDPESYGFEAPGDPHARMRAPRERSSTAAELAPAGPAPDGSRSGEARAASGQVRALFDLFLPLVLGGRARELAVGHLGQSLDGRVATPTGASQFITGREDVVHTHRLRALFDAVLVGVRTVLLDDPQLTTRLVPGRHPTRVILDPQAKLQGRHKVLDDGATATLICTASTHTPRPRRRGHAEWLGLPCRQGRFDLGALLRILRERGLSRLFVEGGGVTVSHFLAERLLDRLHVGVAPMILGSGAPAFALPPIDRLDEALTLRCRHFSLGSDVLFDCDLSASARAAAE